MKRHWLPASSVLIAVISLTVLRMFMQKPVYEAEGKIILKKMSTTSSLTGLGKEIGELNSLSVDQSNPANTEAVILSSSPVLQSTINKLKLKDQKGETVKVENLLKKITIGNIPKTDIIKISYKDKDPQKAAAVVNTIMAVYIENSRNVNRGEAFSAHLFIESQLPKAQSAVHKAEEDLSRFKEQNKVVDLQQEARSAVEIIAHLQEQIVQAQSGLADTDSQFKELQNQLQMDSQKALAIGALQSPAVQDAFKEFQQVERQLALERTRLQEINPIVTTLKSKEATLKALLQERVKEVLQGNQQLPSGNLQTGDVKLDLIKDFVKLKVKYQGLASQVAALSQAQASYKTRLNTLPKLEQQERDLESRLQAYQSTYTLLLQKLQEIGIAENQQVVNARIIQAAFVPDDPGSGKILFIATGIIVGSVLSIATSLVLNAIDKSIRTVEEVKNLFGFTLLGVIPFYKKSEKINLRDKDLEQFALHVVVRDNPCSPISAAYGMLQANLEFLSSDKAIKSIAVTSSVPKEGKSTVCANLAATMAQAGHRVLLVDADMHCPLQHRIWELSNQVGLSNVIIGRTELSIAITKQVMVNLDVLTSGLIPPNPKELLTSQRLAALMEEFASNYDLVIIDTPSLKVTTEALIMNKIVDGLLLVVRPGVVDSPSATSAKELLEKSGHNILGQVVNGFHPKKELHSYYYFTNESYPKEIESENPSTYTETKI